MEYACKAISFDEQQKLMEFPVPCVSFEPTITLEMLRKTPLPKPDYSVNTFKLDISGVSTVFSGWIEACTSTRVSGWRRLLQPKYWLRPYVCTAVIKVTQFGDPKKGE